MLTTSNYMATDNTWYPLEHKVYPVLYSAHWYYKVYVRNYWCTLYCMVPTGVSWYLLVTTGLLLHYMVSVINYWCPLDYIVSIGNNIVFTGAT